MPPLPEPFTSVMVFVLGLLFGSFLNVCILRLPAGESIVTPRSRCPRCKSLIRWYENVPVLSWIALRGKCSHCGNRISPRYALVELMTAGIALIRVYRHGIS